MANAYFLLVSSIAVYGTPPPRKIDSQTDPHPTTPYGRSKLEAEERCRLELPSLGIMRCAVVYGPGDRGNVGRLMLAIDRGRALVVGNGRNRKSLLYSGNLAERILSAVKISLNGVWCAADSPAPSQRELVDEMSRALGRPTPIAIPHASARVAALLADGLGSIFGRNTAWQSTISTLASSSEVDGAALDSQLGYTQRASLSDGIAQTVRALRVASKVPPGT
jgi:nucleoside-diphosphate-sugar epimerase